MAYTYTGNRMVTCLMTSRDCDRSGRDAKTLKAQYLEINR